MCPGNYEVVTLRTENLNSGKQGMHRKLCTHNQYVVSCGSTKTTRYSFYQGSHFLLKELVKGSSMIGGISLRKYPCLTFWHTSVNRGFPVELTCFSGVMTRTRSLADLARRNIALQDKYLPAARPNISPERF